MTFEAINTSVDNCTVEPLDECCFSILSSGDHVGVWCPSSHRVVLHGAVVGFAATQDDVLDGLSNKQSGSNESIAQHEPGAKLDSGKPRCELVLGEFSLALLEVSKVGTFGAAKYSDNGWLKVPNAIKRYTGALWRHILYWREVTDSDSGLSHTAHIAWNALAVLELELRKAKEIS